ncbi:5,6-dimethylbenzimidazole synthase [Roseateles sp.]|uniref:5,6-dimethylbenzimidazole synthase n=1 Tax=Roseateles sp. TaxID=1971397 RepID=UPI00286CA377|nr:5,6-dimethylbenzimidazole synthase [Roseateles sp.]
MNPQYRFSAAEQSNFYELVGARRDCRHFKPGEQVEAAQLQRILQAGYQSPSVGLMQPWRLLRIADAGLREALTACVELERQATAAALGPRSDEFMRLKVEGLKDCAEILALVLAPDDGTVFGRRTLAAEMALASVGCMVQNLWLAARVENLGLGWVSMFEPAEVGALLRLPAGAQALGLLCLGAVDEFYPAPMLTLEGWREPRPLDQMMYTDYWPDGPERTSHGN